MTSWKRQIYLKLQNLLDLLINDNPMAQSSSVTVQFRTAGKRQNLRRAL